MNKPGWRARTNYQSTPQLPGCKPACEKYSALVFGKVGMLNKKDARMGANGRIL